MKKLEGETLRSNYGKVDRALDLKGEASRKNPIKVFDWNAAAQKIREVQPKVAQAGLQDDFEHTGAVIYQNGQIVTKKRTHLSSTWAIPVLVLDDEIYECYLMEKETNFTGGTKWPKSAIRILKGE